MISRYIFMFLLLVVAPLFSAEAPRELSQKERMHALWGQALMREIEGESPVVVDGQPVSARELERQYDALCAAEKKNDRKQESEQEPE